MNLRAVASSQNYETYKRLHTEYIQQEHEKNHIQVEQISASIHVKKPFVKCFGTLIPITEVEAKTRNIEIIWQ